MKYELYESCDSTNRIAKELAKAGAPHGTCVVSGEQTAGRGRMGRSFYSPKGRGLYMSFVLCPKAAGEGQPAFDPANQLLTVYAAYAVSKALDRFTCPIYDLETKIKWVNDIFLHGRKIAGILAENVDLTNEKGGAVILGIGVNLFGREADFPDELKQSASTLFNDLSLPEITAFFQTRNGDYGLGNQKIPRTEEELRDMVRDAISEEILKWDGGAFPADMIEEYQRRSYLLGRSIDFTLDGRELYGVVTSVMTNGNLMVVLPEGKHVSLSSGEISLHKKHL